MNLTPKNKLLLILVVVLVLGSLGWGVKTALKGYALQKAHLSGPNSSPSTTGEMAISLLEKEPGRYAVLANPDRPLIPSGISLRLLVESESPSSTPTFSWQVAEALSQNGWSAPVQAVKENPDGPGWVLELALIRLPGKEGISFTKEVELAQILLSPPVVITTAALDPEISEAYDQKGAKINLLWRP